MGTIVAYKELLAFGEFVDNKLLLRGKVLIEKTAAESMQCIRVSSIGYYTGEVAPKISFLLTLEGQSKPLYQSHSYRIGKKDEKTLQSFRVPPMLSHNMTFGILIDIPEGTELYIENFCAEYEQSYCKWNGDGPRHNAHLGFWGIAPNNTMPAFELAAMCGFPACICVPKWTKDGVLVCIHDDTINKTARDSDGKKEEEPIYVWDRTYDELCRYEYGSYKNEVYKGTKMPLLEDFFKLCAKTGMTPMFSTHPGLSVEQWQEVKAMLKRYGLLKKFHIKSFGFGVLKTAISVFGDEIDGYTWDNDDVTEEKVENLKELTSELSSRVGIEIQFDLYTKEKAEMITSAGFFAAAWNIKRRDFDEYERLYSYGVTEFTEDFHCSMGLNY